MRWLVMMIVATLSLPCDTQAENCNPAEFMSHDTNALAWSESVKYAYLMSATSEQYKKTQDSWRSGASYGPISGNMDLDTARETARRDSLFKELAFSQDTYLNYLSQRLSPVAADMYQKCLRNQRGPGIEIWVDKRDGDFYTLHAFWIGGNNVQGEGVLKLPVTLLNVQLVSKSNHWPKGEPQQLIVYKPSNVDGLLSLEISDQTKGIILLRDLPASTSKHVVVDADADKLAASGGRGKGSSCGAGRYSEVESCVHPQHGGYLVPKSIHAKATINGDGARSEVTKDTFAEACVKLIASTGACERYVQISGRASALEVYEPSDRAAD